MKRKEFVALAVGLSACCCGGSWAVAQTKEDESPEVQDLKRRIEFMQKRMARLVRALDEPTRQKVLETMGRECAKEFGSLTDRFRGRPEAFLEEARRQWMDSATYDQATGTIRVMDRASTCTCAFVNPDLTPADFCACTLGWQKEAYSAILGEPVDVELEDSILRGGKRCAFRITCRNQASATASGRG